ncbi:Uncharacterized protein PCOAH_00038680 [Plasmodium coatneyi]|uniref:Pinin/SDK/MemA protein domain-containing protein n=1 Tax=Plasmodium coatneyi TaxID=208452 RepID=A0A1B1E4W4_9APIC|nr:Uncharacterized protein PCOAH_00038680 [Plasmodium coatneyi]ANQ10017.1 Uncharacterized protein PCOAH_00038680 [Plasmodium coatneyi]
MKSYLSEEDKLKLTIKKNYLERDAIKTKILNYLNRLSHLCSDDKDELNRRERQKRGFFEESLEYFPEFKVEKRPKIEQDETTVTRNRRLLQVGLFEHLKKAKDALEQEKSNETVIKQQMQNKRVEEKLQEEKKKFEKYQIDDIEKKINTHIKEIKNVDSHIKTDEAKLMKLSLINHYEKMKNFISTNCQPTIFWCPLKFNSKTEMLQKETDNFIRKKIEAIKESNYDVDFEEEPWVRQFENLKEIVRRRNGGEATEKGDMKEKEDEADQEGKEDNEDNDDDDKDSDKDDDEEEEEEKQKENNDEENEDENNDHDDGEDEVGKESPNGSHYTEEKEEDTQGTPKKSPSNASDVNTSQKGNTSPGGDNKSSEEFYPDNADDEDLKCKEVNEAHDADEAGEPNGTDEPNETIELDEGNEANVTNETNEANETNETVGDDDASAVKKNSRKKRRGRPKRKGR